jgi:hypothetical protein
MLSSGGAEDMPMSKYPSIPGIGIIDLDATELPSNDREILEIMTDLMFADPPVSGAEIPEAAASTDVASADAGASTSTALIPDIVVSEQPVLPQVGDVEGPAPSAASEAAEGVFEESAAGTKSAMIVPLLLATRATVTAPPPLMVGAVEEVVGVAEPSSVQPAAIAEEEEDAPEMNQPTVVLQDRDASEDVARAVSQEIQETGESSGAALPQDVRGGDAWVLDLARVPWTAVFEVGDDIEDDEEAVACNTLERGLAWACHAFDELILPTTSVSSLITNDLSSISSAFLRCVTSI